MVDVQVNHYGKHYKAKMFTSDQAANAFMRKNPAWGVIRVEGQKIYVAAVADKGESLSKQILDLLDEARLEVLKWFQGLDSTKKNMKPYFAVEGDTMVIFYNSGGQGNPSGLVPEPVIKKVSPMLNLDKQKTYDLFYDSAWYPLNGQVTFGGKRIIVVDHNGSLQIDHKM